MSYEPEGSSGGRSAAVKSSVSVPAILLIIVGILNILGGIYSVFSGYQVSQAGGKVQQELAKNPEQQKQLQELEKQGVSVEGIMKGYSTAFVVGGILGVICGLVTTLGGVKMMSLSGYGLAMTGSILAMIPCTSPCCILGLPFGIWSVVVLNKPEVKSAFR